MPTDSPSICPDSCAWLLSWSPSPSSSSSSNVTVAETTVNACMVECKGCSEPCDEVLRNEAKARRHLCKSCHEANQDYCRNGNVCAGASGPDTCENPEDRIGKLDTWSPLSSQSSFECHCAANWLPSCHEYAGNPADFAILLFIVVSMIIISYLVVRKVLRFKCSGGSSRFLESCPMPRPLTLLPRRTECPCRFVVGRPIALVVGEEGAEWWCSGVPMPYLNSAGMVVGESGSQGSVAVGTPVPDAEAVPVPVPPVDYDVVVVNDLELENQSSDAGNVAVRALAGGEHSDVEMGGTRLPGRARSRAE